MFGTVVIPVAWGDPPESVATAVDHGALLARQARAAVELLTVRPSYVDADRVADHLEGIAEAHGIEAGIRVDDGDPAATIAEIASHPGNLLVMASHGRRPLAELALGSVSAQVVRTCRRPVVLIGPRCGPAPEAYTSLIVALDGSELSEAILPVAITWSRHLDLTPWIFQVLPARVPLEVGDPAADLQEAAYVHHVADTLSLEGIKAGWDTAHDRHPATAITHFAEAHGPAIVALTTHGRSGLDHLLMGSVALATTHEATCPVLVHHPRHQRTGGHQRPGGPGGPGGPEPRPEGAR